MVKMQIKFKEAKMKWINIKDELPKHYQKVIVGRENEPDVMKVITFREKYIGQDYWGDCMVSLFAKPTHWMPLPPPPSSSNND